jgi:hypothetical protein
MSAPQPEGELIFKAPDDTGFPYMLFFCVLGSLLAHAATFGLFQVVYPQRVTIPQPAPHVSLLTPSSPENIALLRWIEAEDPALMANDNAAPPPGLVGVAYQPSFATPRTAPLGAPVDSVPPVRFPRAEDRLAPVGSGKTALAARTVVHPKDTTITWSGALAARQPAAIPHVVVSHSATAPVEPTTILLGVDAQGAVRFCFLQRSSGDPALDEAGLAQVRKASFATADVPMTWGIATFCWGGDAYAAVEKTP